MKISAFFIALLLMLPVNYRSQKRLNTDSIKIVLKKTKKDMAKIPLYFLLSSDYTQNDTDSALYFLQQGKTIIDRNKAHQYDYDYFFSGVKIYHATQDFDKALAFTKNALKTADKNKNQLQKAEALRTLFVIYMNLEKDTLAIQTAQKAQQLTEKLNDTTNLSMMYGNLARLYYEIGSFEKSLAFGKKGIEAGKKYHNLKGLLISLNNTAVTSMELNDNKHAEKIFVELLKIAKENNIPRSQVKALVNLTNLKMLEGNRPAFLSYYRQLQHFLQQNPNAPFAQSDLKQMPIYTGYKELYENHFQQAENTAKQGITELKGDNELVKKIMDLLSEINFAKRDYDAAGKYRFLSDSVQVLLDQENLTNFEAELSKKYETEKKETQIKLQESKIKQKNILNYLLIGGTLALLTILGLSYRNHNHRKKLQQQRITELETEKQLLAAESLLQGQEEERSRLAKDLHDGLGGLLSGIKLQLGAMKGNLILTQDNANAFDRALSKLDESIGEMRRVAHNMMPESLVRSGLKQAILDYCTSLSENQKFTINCELHGIDEKLNGSTEVILYRIVQELVNNAVKHAEATEILVQIFRHENGHFSITVEDNGKGFDVEKTNFMQSAGMRNMRSRINYVRGTMDVKSAPGKGTSIFIECQDENNG